VSKRGLPDDAILSIRSGAVRRQGAISGDKSFLFPQAASEGDCVVKVDIMQTIGSGYVVVRPNQTQGKQYEVELGEGRALDLEIRSATGAAPAAEEAADTAKTKTDAKAYLESAGLVTFLQGVLQVVALEKPQDPFAAIAAHCLRAAGGDSVHQDIAQKGDNAPQPGPVRETGGDDPAGEAAAAPAAEAAPAPAVEPGTVEVISIEVGQPAESTHEDIAQEGGNAPLPGPAPPPGQAAAPGDAHSAEVAPVPAIEAAPVEVISIEVGNKTESIHEDIAQKGDNAPLPGPSTQTGEPSRDEAAPGEPAAPQHALAPPADTATESPSEAVPAAATSNEASANGSPGAT